MATIRAFCPICPNPFYAGELVFTKLQTESVAEQLLPLKTVLETGARQRPETPEGQEQAYADIRNALADLLAKEHLWQENSPGIYVYETVHSGRKQTGVWALTDLNDYRSGKIKVHEQTLADSVRRLRNYREHTGLEGSPVLLTYHPDKLINQVIADVKRNKADMALGNSHGMHRLWKVSDHGQQELLVLAFKRIDRVYLADGHHRLESAASLPVYGSISSLYMATDELRIEPYDRVVIPDTPYDVAELIKMINHRFHMLESAGKRPVRPQRPCRMGMYLGGQWYHLLLKSEFCDDTALDMEILQKHLLDPVFRITDPKTDGRLKYAGGEKALEEIAALLQEHPAAIAFTLSPLTPEQLVTAADEGRVLPPKATWIAPKVPYGLLIQKHDHTQ
ncbi:MAG: DUF1015 domain-containing protein [Bacteroidetes bacterium]|nr:DUF1015 domain-containing protein [Bacteroidota bacterium]